LNEIRLLSGWHSGHIYCVKACGYCGRENEPVAAHCRECGTEFSVHETTPETDVTAETLRVEQPFTDLSDLDMGFETVEGFSWPHWKTIREFVKAHVPKDDLPAVANQIAYKWLKELAGDLGGEAKVFCSPNFFCLSDLEPQKTRGLLDYMESTLRKLGGFLRSAAWNGYDGKHVILVFADGDDYFAYTSYFHKAGVHILTSGMFIRRGYAHIAMPYVNPWSAQHVMVHELTHNLLCHLPMPLWLNEGLAVTSEKLVLDEAFILEREKVERHRRHWNESNIQAFWAGKTYDMPGDDSELSYSLGEIMVRLLAEQSQEFIPFVKMADWRDAGQGAAVEILGMGLEEVLGGFLGPGDWRPQRKAISELLNRNKKSD
jgi:hypothetical protein